MLVSLYDIISCDVINIKNFREILRYFFKILATPLLPWFIQYISVKSQGKWGNLSPKKLGKVREFC